MPPDVRDWLPEDRLAWFLIDAVAEMHLDAFYAAYRVDERSRPAYDPAMMVAVLPYSYARGNRASRQIERACEEDVAFRVLAAQQRPDHATIARFVERHHDAIAGLFGEVLTLCARQGLASVGVIAVDGTKVPGNANLDYEQILEEAQAVDATEDELDRDARGDELPEQLRAGEGRRAWLREAKRQLEEQRAREARPVARDRPKRLKEAKRRLDEELWTPTVPTRRGGRAASRRTGRGAWQRARPSLSRRRRCRRKRSTSPTPTRTSSRARASAGSCRATTRKLSPTSIRSCRRRGDDRRTGLRAPRADARRRPARTRCRGRQRGPDVLLADAGYWHQQQMQRIVDQGIQVPDPATASGKCGSRFLPKGEVASRPKRKQPARCWLTR
jgi:transposase